MHLVGAYVDLKGVKKSTVAKPAADDIKSSVEVKSDVIFETIEGLLKDHIDIAKSINGVFQYNITKGGQIVRKWSKFLFSFQIDINFFRPKDFEFEGKHLLCYLLICHFMKIFAAIDLKKIELYEGPPKGVKPDTTLTVTDDDFVDIVFGKINPQLAFMKGKLKIAGNIMLLQKLVPLLKMAPKL